ncbi:MAG: hypothetical protein SPJ04_06120 [Bdellovibrionota bacterium]|nr:hypothetical protein [Pseudomonadota bacterium]MDY6090812.1 hypothetical protein [Bdellovibrionota bacterium]
MKRIILLSIFLSLISCSPKHEPETVVSNTFMGAATGAGAGAVTGAQLSAGTGPGAAVGAGFGAFLGAVNGLLSERLEYQMKVLEAETNKEKARAYAQQIIKEQYERRLKLHPTRDFYPADLFFYGDEVTLRPNACFLIEEIAKMSKERLPWSRLVVTNYVVASDDDSSYAKHLSRKRSQAIVNELVRLGIEGRRLVSRGVSVREPVLLDPDDYPLRYSQAVEFTAIDR